MFHSIKMKHRSYRYSNQTVKRITKYIYGFWHASAGYRKCEKWINYPYALNTCAVCTVDYAVRYASHTKQRNDRASKQRLCHVCYISLWIVYTVYLPIVAISQFPLYVHIIPVVACSFHRQWSDHHNNWLSLVWDVDQRSYPSSNFAILAELILVCSPVVFCSDNNRL